MTPEKLPNYEENTKKFFTEHLHDHEEIRFIIDGVGSFQPHRYQSRLVRLQHSVHTERIECIDSEHQNCPFRQFLTNKMSGRTY